MGLWQMSYTAGVMILVITAIRAFLVHKLPKKTFMVLWGIVLVRLLVPFQISSEFSVYSLVVQNDAKYENTAEVTDEMKNADGGDKAQGITDKNVQSSAGEETKLSEKNTEKHAFLIDAIRDEIRETEAFERIHNRLIKLSPYLWAVGVFVSGGYFMISYIRCQKKFRMSLPVENIQTEQWLRKQTLRRKVRIRQSDCITTPLTYGVFAPVILLPKNVLSEKNEELEYILEHELVHVKRYDIVTKLFLIAALCIHWFNPCVWLMYTLFNRDMELACDEAVLNNLGENKKSAYALALISMEEKKSGLTPFYSSFSRNAMEERIKAIMKSKRITLLTGACAIVLVIIIAVVFATTATESKDEIYAEYKKDVFLNQVLNNDIGLSEDNLSLDYADKDTIIFHEKYGIFIYSISEKHLTDAISWEDFGYLTEVTSDTTNTISVNKNGTKIYIQSADNSDVYVYDVNNMTIQKAETDLPDTEKFNNKILTNDYITPDHTVGRTNYCVPITDSACLYLESGSGTLQDIFYVIENTRGDRETGCIFEVLSSEQTVTQHQYFME